MTASLAIGFQSLARYGLLTWVPVHFLGIEQELGIGKVILGRISCAMLWCYAIGQAVNGNVGMAVSAVAG